MLRRVGLVKTNVSEENVASIISVKIIGELGIVTANFGPSSLILFILMMEATRSSETSVLTTATRRHIPEDGNFQPQFMPFT
jgi:hypothetical protein